MEHRIVHCMVLLGSALLMGACAGNTDSEPGDSELSISDSNPSERATDPAALLEQMRRTGTLIEDNGEPGLTPKAVTWTDLLVSSLRVNNRADFIRRSSQPLDSEVCVLTGVAGDRENPTVIDGQWNGPFLARAATWELWLGETFGESEGRAVCAPWSNFIGPSSSVKWISDKFEYHKSASSDISGTRNAWFGDAATFLSGVMGEMEGYGEKIFINQSTSATTSSQLRVESTNGHFGNDTGIRGEAYSMFVGVPGSSKLVSLIGYNTAGTLVKGNVKSSGTFEFQVATDSGFSGFWLARTGEALCYLTYVTGDFNGWGDSARISAQSGSWFLEARDDDGGKVRARARCMAYDQR